MHNFLLTGLASSGESCDVGFLGSFAALLSEPVRRREDSGWGRVLADVSLAFISLSQNTSTPERFSFEN